MVTARLPIEEYMERKSEPGNHSFSKVLTVNQGVFSDGFSLLVSANSFFTRRNVSHLQKHAHWASHKEQQGATWLLFSSPENAIGSYGLAPDMPVFGGDQKDPGLWKW